MITINYTKSDFVIRWVRYEGVEGWFREGRGFLSSVFGCRVGVENYSMRAKTLIGRGC